MPSNAPLRPLIPTIAAAFALAIATTSLAAPAYALEKLRVGKAVPEAFSFVPLDIGMRKGFFAKNGLEIESIAFAGDARMQQAMASDSLDIAHGSGPAMAFNVKGSPIKVMSYFFVWCAGGSTLLWWCGTAAAASGLGAERHRHRADGGDARTDRGAQARRHRRRDHGHRQRFRA
jgi:hypothetical protein